MSFLDFLYKPALQPLYDNEKATNAKNDANRQLLQDTGTEANQFARSGQQNYGMMTAEAQRAREGLRRLASGQDSYSAEQLRQGLQQQYGQQRSMAASASPQNAAMAARTGAMNMGRAGSAMAGNAALAGIQERSAANNALMGSILQQRGQDSQVALGSRQNAVNAYGGVDPAQSYLDRYGNQIAGGLGAAAKFSDKRLKEDIEDGDSEANQAMKGLRAFTYRYKNKQLGKDREVGIMAQDLEKAGLKHTIIETPRGKAVHGAALSTANTAMLSALERRVSKIEGGRK